MLNRLNPFNFVNDIVYASDDTYLYGKSTETIAGRWLLSEINAGTTAADSNGHDFGAGTAIEGCWTIESGHIFYLVKVTATTQYSLWRSNFTTAAGWSAGTFSNVGDFGESGGSPIPNVSILHKAFCEVDVQGVKKIYLYEYNVNGSRTLGSTNDGVRILQSVDNGATWTVAMSFNTSGHQVKHGHAIAQNPVTKEIYFGAGDSGAVGTADTGQSLIAWDGITAFPPANTLPADFDAYDGFSSVADITNSRTVAFLFDDEGYVYTGTDANTTAELGGIWRWSHDLSTSYQVDNSEVQFSNHTMWWAAQHNGVHYWIDDVSSTTVVADAHINIYASDTPARAGSYKIIGRLTVEDGGGGFAASGSPNAMIFAGDKLIISSPAITGKTYNQTVVIEITDERWKDQIDIVAPCVYVDPINGSDSNTGWFPDDAWARVRKALTASEIAHGTSVQLLSDDSDASFISMDWSAYSTAGAANGPVNAPVQLRGKGRTDTTFTVTNNGNTLYFGAVNHSLETYDVRIRNTTATNHEIFNLVAADCTVKTCDSWLGDLTKPSRMYRANSGANCTATAIRTLHQGTDARIAIQKGGSVTGYTVYGEASIFEGFDNITLAEGDSDFSFYNCTGLNWKATRDGFDEGSSLTTAVRYKNNALYQPVSGVSINVQNGVRPTIGTQCDFNIANTATVPTGYEGTNGSIVDPLLDLTTYAPQVGSPCIGAGQDVGVTYDYNGNLYRTSSPSVGAIEGNPLDFYTVPSGGGAPRNIINKSDSIIKRS